MIDPTSNVRTDAPLTRDTETPSRSSEQAQAAPCRCGLASSAQDGGAYNEEAFRYFLEVERKRSDRSSRPFLLLLVDLKPQPAESPRIEADMARALFSSLGHCLRETDFIGWYREHRVAGAVLTQLNDAPGTDLSGVTGQRIRTALAERLPKNLASRLQVRVYQLPPQRNQQG